MSSKTLKELRALARSQGLKGYSKLSRSELERLLATSGAQKPEAAKKTAQARKKIPAPARSKPAAAYAAAQSARAATKKARAGGAKKPASSVKPAGAPAAPAAAAPGPAAYWAGEIYGSYNEEQRVENAKYAMVPPGSMAPAAVATDLGEDIDRLPEFTEAMLCLLPQKPGVLHGYWAAPPGSVPDFKSLKLRLGRLNGDAFDIIEEVSLSQGRGHWYFHLDESADVGEVYLQLGYYEPDGRFITATRRGIARIPSLYASGSIDRLWWISEEQFRTMYLRAGGFVQGPRLGWAASIGSPGGAPGAPSGRLAWPGGVSSGGISSR